MTAVPNYSFYDIPPEAIDLLKFYLPPVQLSKLSRATKNLWHLFQGTTWSTICVYNPSMCRLVDTGRYRYVAQDSFLKDLYDSQEWSPSHSVLHIIIDSLALTNEMTLPQLREALEKFPNLKTVRILTGHTMFAPFYFDVTPSEYRDSLHIGNLVEGKINTSKMPYMHNTMNSSNSVQLLRSSIFTLQSYSTFSHVDPNLFQNLTTVYWHTNLLLTDVAPSNYYDVYEYLSKLPALATLVVHHYSVISLKALKKLRRNIKHLEVILTLDRFDQESEEFYQDSSVYSIPQATALVLRLGAMRPHQLLSVFEKYKFPNLKFADVSSMCNSVFFNPVFLPLRFDIFPFGGFSYGDTCFLDSTNLTHLSVCLTTLSCIKSFVNHINKFSLKNLSVTLLAEFRVDRGSSNEIDKCFKELALYFIDNSTGINSIGDDIFKVDFSSHYLKAIEAVQTIVIDPIGELNRKIAYDEHVETNGPVLQCETFEELILECLYLCFDRMKSLEQVELHYSSKQTSFFSPRLLPLLSHPSLKRLELIPKYTALNWPDVSKLTEPFGQTTNRLKYLSNFGTYLRKSFSITRNHLSESFILDAESYREGFASSLLGEPKLMEPVMVENKMNPLYCIIYRPLGYVPTFYKGWSEIEDREVISVYSVDKTSKET